MVGWVNGNEYEQSTETFGILPLSEAMHTKLGMLPYHNIHARETKIHHHYLAQCQQTRVAVLPVHTQQEWSLYRLLVKQSNGLFSGTKQPNWVAVAVEWSKYADGIHIFYKVCKSDAKLHPIDSLCDLDSPAAGAPEKLPQNMD